MEELIKEWMAELAAQNSLLEDQGEEPVTLEEFVSCRVDDVRSERARLAEEHKREWWATYRAALTGNSAWSAEGFGLSTTDAHTDSIKAADEAHGPLKPEGE